MSTVDDAGPEAAEGGRDGAWERRRREILDGAAQVFSEHGYTKGTTKQIAAKIGLTQPAIYHYVGSKADLLREIAEQVDHDMTAALDRGLASADDPTAQLRGVMRAFTEAVVANRFTYAVYRQETRSLEPEVAARIRKDEREFIAAVRRLVSRAQSIDALPSGSPSVITYALLNMASEVWRWYRPEESMSPSEIADTFCRLIGLPETP